MTDGIVIAVRDGIGRIRIDRPAALNAITPAHIAAIAEALDAWEDDPAVRCVVVEGAGDKAFSAGGDIRALREAVLAGNADAARAFYAEEYRQIARFRSYPKPYVALMDGITMGGGVGLAVYGTFRVATERTLLAMPETAIGFFPDIGATYFLPRLPGRLGAFMALTGARLNSADCLRSGLATHFVPSHRLAELVAALADGGDVAATLDGFAADPGAPSVLAVAAEIDRLFAGDTVDEIVSALDAAGRDEQYGAWAAKTAAVVRSRAPLSQKVALRQIKLGTELGFEDCLRLEYALATRMALAHDFAEGVRAVLVDKDHAPRWRPATLAEVDEEAHVAPLFQPLPEGDLSF